MRVPVIIVEGLAPEMRMASAARRSESALAGVGRGAHRGSTEVVRVSDRAANGGGDELLAALRANGARAARRADGIPVRTPGGVASHASARVPELQIGRAAHVVESAPPPRPLPGAVPVMRIPLSKRILHALRAAISKPFVWARSATGAVARTVRRIVERVRAIAVEVGRGISRVGESVGRSVSRAATWVRAKADDLVTTMLHNNNREAARHQRATEKIAEKSRERRRDLDRATEKRRDVQALQQYNAQKNAQREADMQFNAQKRAEWLAFLKQPRHA